VAALRTVLKEAGLTAKHYAGHSVPIRTATAAAQQGHSLIKTLEGGREKPTTRYIEHLGRH